jgi:hypothetical protein
LEAQEFFRDKLKEQGYENISIPALGETISA